MQTYKTKLARKVSLPDDVELLTFTIEQSPMLSFVPGQYMILNVPSTPQPLKRLYSIASSCGVSGSFDLLIKHVPGGNASNYIKSISPGQLVEFQGPAGVFSLKNTPADKVFLATGTGLAPIRSFILSNPQHTQKYHLFWGISGFKQAYLFSEQLDIPLNNSLLSIHVSVSREASLEGANPAQRPFFSLGHIQDSLTPFLASRTEGQSLPEFYICGRREVVEGLRSFLNTHGVASDRVFFERY